MLPEVAVAVEDTVAEEATVEVVDMVDEVVRSGVEGSDLTDRGSLRIWRFFELSIK